MVYLDNVLIGIIVFPIIALIFTFPYMLFQYHKYGSINKFRTLVIYSFIFYLLVAFFMTLLPLPDPATTIGSTWRQHLNLVPFKSIINYWKDISFNFTNIKLYLKSFDFWQIIFNIFLTIPFGIYLHYYFKKDLKHTFFYSLLLSLFFEITQITGIYGIYPGPYRFADIEDIITNTLGGVLGYFIAYLFMKVLPSRDKLDEESICEGKVVSGKRRLTAVIFDYLFIYLLYVFLRYILIRANPELSIYFEEGYEFYWSLFCLVSLIQVLLSNGFTLGHMICGIRLVSANKSRLSYILRYFIIWLFTDGLLLLRQYLTNNIIINSDISFLLIIISRLYLLIYFFIQLFSKENKKMLHDKISKCEYVSIVSQKE